MPLQRQRYDLIFMDVQMPVMDGLRATRIIRERYTGDDRPHIVALTANVMASDREACMASGMDDFLSKPIRLEEVRSIVEKYGSTARSRDRVVTFTHRIRYIASIDPPQRPHTMNDFRARVFGYNRKPKPDEALQAILEKIPVFEGFSPRELAALGRVLHKREYLPDEVIIRQDEPGLGMYIIQSGRSCRRSPAATMCSCPSSGTAISSVKCRSSMRPRVRPRWWPGPTV